MKLQLCVVILEIHWGDFMKKVLLFFEVLFLIVTFLGCGENFEKDGGESPQEMLSNMESYSCKASVLAVSNKGQNAYDVNILWEKGGKYRIETTSPKLLEGNVILFDGKGIWQYNPNVKSKISFVGIGGEFDGKSKIFISEFMKNYLKCKDSSEEEVKLGGKKFIVFYANVDGGKYFKSQKLWFDIEKGEPSCLETFDDGGKLAFKAEFSDFKFNVQSDEKAFDPLESFPK